MPKLTIGRTGFFFVANLNNTSMHNHINCKKYPYPVGYIKYNNG